MIDLELTDDTPRASGPEGVSVSLRDLMHATVFGEPDQTLKDRYRLYRHVSSTTPPTFIWHTADDQAVFAHNALRFATALADHNVPYELHIFGGGVHGLSLADDTTNADEQFLNPRAQMWIELALTWLKDQREQRSS